MRDAVPASDQLPGVQEKNADAPDFSSYILSGANDGHKIRFAANENKAFQNPPEIRVNTFRPEIASRPDEWIFGRYGLESAGDKFKASYSADGHLEQVQRGDDTWRRTSDDTIEYSYKKADGQRASVEFKDVKSFSLGAYFYETTGSGTSRTVESAEALSRSGDKDFYDGLMAGTDVKIKYGASSSVSYGGTLWTGEKYPVYGGEP